MKVADISNEARPLSVASPWVDCLLQEFFNQVGWYILGNISMHHPSVFTILYSILLHHIFIILKSVVLVVCWMLYGWCCLIIVGKLYACGSHRSCDKYGVAGFLVLLLFANVRLISLSACRIQYLSTCTDFRRGHSRNYKVCMLQTLPLFHQEWYSYGRIF